MATPSRAHQRVRFGEFEVDLTTRELWSNGTKQTLAPQPFQVLKLMIERHGELVTRDDLIRHLWPSDTFVDYDQGIKKAIKRVREILNDSAEAPRFIETLPRQGYRFIGELEPEAAPLSHPAAPIVLHPHLVEPEPAIDAPRRKPILRNPLVWTVATVICTWLLLWQWRVSHRTPPASREPKFTQLTANSFENPITTSAISPDGKYLAFTDATNRIRVRMLGTGETHTIPEPESLEGRPVDWTVAGWFPDSTRFLANGRSPGSLAWFPSRFRFAAKSGSVSSTGASVSQAASVWVVSILGNTVKKLRDDAEAFSVSPDGLWIAFGTKPAQLGDHEIWLMEAGGQQARKLYEAPPNTGIGGLKWSLEGQRVFYLQVSNANAELVSRDLQGGPVVTLVQSPDWFRLTDFVALPDGRVIYARDHGLWELRTDPRTGGPTGKSSQLTNWSGAWVGEISVTADGMRLVYQRSVPQTTVNVADLEANGQRVSSPRHLVLNEYVSAAETWTPDSKALLFRSVRNGHFWVFKQALNSDTDEPLVLGSNNTGGSAISPDGSWLYYLDCGVQPLGGCEGTVPVMAIPIAGGTPRLVMKSDTYGRPRCSVAPGKYCLVAEQSGDGKPLTFTSFDALQGRGAEVARFETEPGATYGWALSRDGTHIAVFKLWDARVHIISLTGQPPQEIAVRGWTNLISLFWAADGKGLFAASKSKADTVLLHINLRGEAHSLWEQKGNGDLGGQPSPDGRHLAIVANTRSNNVWMMENP
jgi:eukaryotic-like serine/threonine-protein kinase